MTVPGNGDRPGKNGSHSRRPAFGLLEWFQLGDRKRVEEVLADARALGVTEIRTRISWADSHRPDGLEWYDWLLPRLCEEVTILPCFTYTPPSEGIVAKSSSPPRYPRAFNIGGGPANTTSLIELTELIERIHGVPPEITYQPWRQPDQRYFVSDVRSFSKETNWCPRTSVTDGVRHLYDWLAAGRADPADRLPLSGQRRIAARQDQSPAHAHELNRS